MARLQVIKGRGGEAPGMGLADYLWLEAGHIGCKKKTILVSKDEKGEPVPFIQRWNRAHADQPQFLSPCFYLPDPTRPPPSYLVLCETRDASDRAYGWRSDLRKAMQARGPATNLVWLGFEQTYSLDLSSDYAAADLAERQFLTAERHIGACFDAGLLLHSACNLPRDPDWQFKVGVRGFPQDLDPDPPSALVVTDHLVIAQYLLEKVAAEKGLQVNWRWQSLFVSIPELREPGQDHQAHVALLLKNLNGVGLTHRVVHHPVNGGCQCIEVRFGQYQDPYCRALQVLEAIWPMETDTAQPPEKDAE